MSPPTAIETAAAAAPETRKARASQLFTMQEIKEQTTGENAKVLIVFHNKVYDLTKWVKYHPGGDLAVMHMNGRDATDAIISYHPEWVLEKKLPHFCVGELAETSRTPSSKISMAYRQLDDRIRKAGLYQTNYNFYIREAVKFAFLWATAVYLILNFGFCIAVCYFVVASCLCCSRCTQLLMHQLFDSTTAGHSGITHDAWTDAVMGICLGNFVGGVSLGWWKKNHNVHHIVTNHPEHDPDIQHMPFLAVTSRLMNNLYSTYYKRVMEFDALAKIMLPIQHYTFYVLLAFGRFNLYVNSIAHLTSKDRVPHRTLELVGIAFFWTWYLSPSPGLIITHIMVSHMFTVLLHVQITLSHFGMPTDIVEGESFAEMALRTSMDVDCPRWFDWFHGGLQFQVVHHLFPRVPRHNLRTVRPWVMEFAQENGLTYHNYKFIKGNRIVLKCLKQVAEEVAASLKAACAKAEQEKKKTL
ncbi:fatty acid desaturase-domain-containing protein [Obelidium mucronatum]|nr:fatty acid desaturase-domain-containing protein [Obelidium mucronatum]